MARPSKGKSVARKRVVLTATLFKHWMYRCIRVPKAAFGIDPPIVPLPVVVSLGEDRFESTLSSKGPDDYYLVVPVAYLKARALEVGDPIRLALEPDLERAAPALPRDLDAYLKAQPALAAEFGRMPIASQRQLVKYIESVANEVSRQSRLEVLGERLRQRLSRRRAKPGA